MHSPQADKASGVPRGTVLPEGSHSSYTKLFPDDCLLFKRITNQNNHKELQDYLSSLEQWGKAWQMEINPTKCTVNVMQVMPPNKTKKAHQTILYILSSSLYQ